MGAPFKAASVAWGVSYTSHEIGSELELSATFTAGVDIRGVTRVGATTPPLECFAPRNAPAFGIGLPIRKPGTPLPVCYTTSGFDFQLTAGIRKSDLGTM